MKRLVGPSGLALVALLALGGTAAIAEEGVAMKNLLGDIGIIPKDKDPIRYRERAPLVLPPKMELREPKAGGGLASSNPQWPKDPDVVARDKRAAEARVPVANSEIRRMSERDGRLTVDELRAGRSASTSSGVVPGTHRGDSARDVLYANASPAPTQTVDTDAGGTPMRRTLSDPPTTFRKTAGGGAVQSDFAGKVDQQAVDANPMAWLTRKFKREDDD